MKLELMGVPASPDRQAALKYVLYSPWGSPVEPRDRQWERPAPFCHFIPCPPSCSLGTVLNKMPSANLCLRNCFLQSDRKFRKQRAQGFPGGSVGKESVSNSGDLNLIPESGRSPAEGNSNPLQCSCLGNPMDRGAWRATGHGVAKSWT